MSSYDMIVIGGGHNGLTAAALLAKAGKKVLVLEKRELLGGIAAGEEFHPGYTSVGLLHDTSCLRTELLKGLDLASHGLKTTGRRASFSLLSKEGQEITMTADTQETADNIAKISHADAVAYLKYRQFIDKIGPFIRGIMSDTAPDVMHLNSASNFWELSKKGIELKRLGNEIMLELLKVAPMPVADFLNDLFETDFLKAGLAAPALYGSWAGPYSAYTTINLLIWECVAQEEVIGGPRALVDALEKACRSAGVEIRTGAEVQRILLNQTDAVTGVLLADGQELNAPLVMSSCTPRRTFLEFFKSNQIVHSFEQLIQQFRCRGTTAKLNLALSEPLQFPQNRGLIRTGNSFDDVEKAFDSVKYREFSLEPMLEIAVPTLSEPSLAPDGHSVASILVHYAPYTFDAGWGEQQKSALKDTVLKTLKTYAPNIEQALVGCEVLSPLDLEQIYGLTEGQIFHGEPALDQVMVRPNPACVHYKTPISGLYLCGSGSHPGGGITCAPGALAAKAVLAPAKNAKSDRKAVLGQVSQEISAKIIELEPKKKKAIVAGSAVTAASALALYLAKKFGKNS